MTSITDLQRSVSWYCSLLDLELSREFVEQGALRGAALLSREGGFSLALRERAFCASQPNLSGFDPVSLHIVSRAALESIVERCDRLGFEHSPVQDRGPNEAVVDVPDPDGTVLRLYWARASTDDDRFMGLAFDDAGEVTFYDTPQLTAPVRT